MYFSLAFTQITCIFNSDWSRTNIQSSYLFPPEKQLCNEHKLKLNSLAYIFSFLFHAVKKYKNKPTSIPLVFPSFYLQFSIALPLLDFFFNEYLSYSPKPRSFCSYFFVTGCPPSCRVCSSMPPIIFCSPPSIFISIVFPHSFLFHPSPLFLITSETGLLTLLSPKGPSSVSTFTPGFGQRRSPLLLLLLLHARCHSADDREDLTLSFAAVP